MTPLSLERLEEQKVLHSVGSPCPALRQKDRSGQFTGALEGRLFADSPFGILHSVYQDEKTTVVTVKNVMVTGFVEWIYTIHSPSIRPQ